MRVLQDMRILSVLISVFLPTSSFAASITVKWQANKEPDVAGYNLYYGTQPRRYGLPIFVGKATTYTIENLTNGTTYYFALTATDTSGNESGYSAEASGVAALSPSAPSNPPSGGSPQSVFLSANLSSPQPEGQLIQLTAQIPQNPSYEYRFEIRKKGKSKWKLLRNYAPEATFTWNTSGRTGKWEIRVKVRDKNNPSKVLFTDKIRKYSITKNRPTEVSLTIDMESPRSIGQTIVFHADAEGGTTDYESHINLPGRKMADEMIGTMCLLGPHPPILNGHPRRQENSKSEQRHG